MDSCQPLYPDVMANGLDVIQGMIDISADRLEGLRTQCATSASLTQQEIRSLETKLVRMFSELLLTKARRMAERMPGSVPTSNTELKQWLRVVGLSKESLKVCLQKLTTVEQLLEKTDKELKYVIEQNPTYRDEEIRRLIAAMTNLKRCQNALLNGEREPDNLFWDSWDRHHHHHRGSTGNIGQSPRTNRNLVKTKNRQSPINNLCGSGLLDYHQVQSPSSITTPDETSSHTLTPSPSPPNSPCLTSGSSSGTAGHKIIHRKSGTPPPKRKHHLIPHNQSTPSHVPMQSQGNSMTTSTSSSSSQDPLGQTTKSKSQEIKSQENSVPNQLSNNQAIPRTRLHTDPSPDNLSLIGSDINTDNPNTLSVPRSPCTPIVPLGMTHTIAHRFTKVFKMMSTCDLCQKQMFFGLKCKECKYRCHKDCEPNVPPSCGLPRAYVDVFIQTLSSSNQGQPNTSPNSIQRRVPGFRANPQIPIHHPDSSSPGSSCNSSSPSSPAPYNMHNHSHSGTLTIGHGTGAINKVVTPSSANQNVSQFNFPDVTITSGYHNQTNTHTLHSSSSSGIGGSSSTGGTTSDSTPNDTPNHHAQSSTAINNISNVSVTKKANIGPHFPTLAGRQNHFNCSAVANAPLSELSDTRKSNDSDKTVSLSGSTSASTDSDRTPVRLDSTEEGDSGNWPRQNSLSLKEWDIPYDDLRLLEKIGKGRFGTVHRALWFGDVAVKLLNEDYLHDDHTLEAFKLEVANFKKTRHENLVLFMGACMNPPYLAIVTSLCKGNTLYTYIHSRRDKFTINRTTLVAQQISQGMGYLHARGIFHKDLRTKNIFLENGKVIITDFGLFSSTKLLYCDLGLGIPNGWLCYLSPELMRSLTPHKPTAEILPFSKASDVYSFGTVWYELLCGEFPFKIQPPEAIIWQVGRGMKQTLANLQTSRDVKDILMLCWSFQADDRPDFQKLLILLEKLPKKRLARSPSHPIQLSRSAESVF